MPKTSYANANVEWSDTSVHDTVALRPGGGPVSHFCAFTNPKNPFGKSRKASFSHIATM